MQVRERLIRLVSETMRMTIPYVRGPEGLGEISVRHAARAGDTLLWVFHNVLVYVSNQGTGVDIEPIAHAIQEFMNRNFTPNFEPSVPAVQALDLSPSPVHVGAQVRVAVQLTSGSERDLTTDFREMPPALLDQQSSDALSANFLAKSPGQTRVEIILIDEKTLLSRPLSVPVEVLP